MPNINYEIYLVRYGHKEIDSYTIPTEGHEMDPIHGWNKYSFSEATGIFTFGDSAQWLILEVPSSSIYGDELWAPGIDEYHLERKSSRHDRTTVTITIFKSEVVGRGGFYNKVIAPEGSYPTDGVHGDLWYIAKDLAETANLTQPLGGENITDLYTIQWAKSSTKVNVDIEVYTGSTWARIGSDIEGLSFEYNFSNLPGINNAKIRVRPVYGNYYGDWFESGTFSIIHNYPPTIPPSI
ncbi:MAG TPA: hypothetical protein VFC79_04665, partial [Tissierellaceae bacterium]|nr:hypothetical protein [Tissierellaceae bacterium]